MTALLHRGLIALVLAMCTFEPGDVEEPYAQQ